MLTLLSAYDFSIQHKAGRLHSNCDALSRRRCTDLNCKYCERVEIKCSGELAEENNQTDLTENIIRKESSPLKVYSVDSNGQCKNEITALNREVGVRQGEY